ncbi:MAG: diaminopimelate epimerase [Chloroflexota bacterium]|nr:diaminopimelate epimerase [Chloroflexota bacterium]
MTSMTLRFTKMHGAGNDYVVIDARDEEREWASVARDLLDRHFGIGADGLLLVEHSTMADVRMRMLNPDGSEAEMCGNGIRCFSKFVIEGNLLADIDDALQVETGAGVLNVEPIMDTAGQISRARVSMGEPIFDPNQIPVIVPQSGANRNANLRPLIGLDAAKLVVECPITVDGCTFNITCVSMGNPHAVAFVDEPVGDVALQKLGPLVEHHAFFPNRVNFHIVNRLNSGQLIARTWERGAGLTLACGTGACAIQAVGRLLGLTEEVVQIEMPGGALVITWADQGPVIMEGPVVKVFDGNWELSDN